MASEYKQLYNCLIDLIPKSYKTCLGYVEETTLDSKGKTIPTTKTTAIYFKGGSNGKRVTDSGKYVSESVRVIFNIFSDKTVLGIDECLEYCDSVKEVLDTTFNKEIIDPQTNRDLRIECLVREGNINELGRNSQGIPVYSINYKMNYTKGGM